MKQYLYMIVISFMPILCLAPSKKNKFTYPEITKTLHQELSKKIESITELISHKPFVFDRSQSLYQQYINWSKTLSKPDLLKIIAFQEQSERGFDKKDALEKIKNLQNKPLSEIYDIFMQYQKQFLSKSNVQDSNDQQLKRLQRLHQEYQTEQNNLSYLRRLPIIHNLETILLPDITSLTDKELYEKISDEMSRIGFSRKSINKEITNLKKNDSIELQKNFPQLQKELAERLSYFNGTKKDSPEYIVQADYYLGLLHTWTTTMASIAASGASLFGLNSLPLQIISKSTLLNPYISQHQNFSKQQVLAMIYAQYKSYDLLQDAYINPDFKETNLLTKAEMLDSIKESMSRLGILPSLIEEQMNKYQNLKKSELEIIQETLEELSKNHHNLDMSDDETRIAALTKNDLLQEIKKYLPNLKMSKKEKQDILIKLKNENVDLVRTFLLDLIDENNKKLPDILSAKESLLMKAPKMISAAISDHAIANIKHDWQNTQKSKFYQYLREKALKQDLGHKQETYIEHTAQQAYEKGSFLRSVIPLD